MENAKILHFPVSFTKEDIEHCVNCMSFVDYFLDDETDGQLFKLNVDDVKYLERLLCRDYKVMCSVVEASDCSDDDI